MTPPALEQLHYTWARRGVEGTNRLQIAAMSPGFRGGSLAPLLPAVRKLCRYDPPARPQQPPPVSFGWLDHRGFRIAFRRLPLPPKQGKRGNFAAHILVGAPGSMPAADLARSYGSPFWWSGEDLAEDEAGGRFELPPAVLPAPAGELGGDPEEIDRAALVLLRSLLELPDRGRLAVVGGSELFAAALARIGSRFPAAIEGLSVSTYEGKPTFPFRLLGGTQPSPRLPSCQLESGWRPESAESRAVERLLEAGRRGELLHAACCAAAPDGDRDRDDDRDGGGDRDRDGGILGRASALVATAEGSGEGPIPRDGAALAYLAGEEAGRERLATLIRTEPTAWERPIAAAVAAMEASELAGLELALASQYERSEPVGCSAALALIGRRVRDTALDAAIGRLLDGGSLGACSDADVGLLVGHAAARGLSAERVEPVLVAAAAAVERCAREPSIPDRYLRTMFVAALSADADPNLLAAAIGARPALLDGSSLDPAQARRCLELLRWLPIELRERPLRAVLPIALRDDPDPALCEPLESLPPAAAARCLLAAAAGLAPEATAQLTAVIRRCAVRLLTGGEPRRASEVLALDPSGDARLAHDVALGTAGPIPQTLAEVTAIEDDELRPPLVELVLRRAVADLPSAAAVEALWHDLGAAWPGRKEAELLRTILAAAHGDPDRTCAGAILCWVAAWLLPGSPRLNGHRGTLRDPLSQNLARDLALEVPAWEWESLRHQAGDLEPVAIKWWSRLERERERAANATRPRRRSRLRGRR